MFLKRITLSGFKSFADRVDFDFGPGVTCVVGPNGCGKSNILDSIRWVLGEQSARSLRGRQMADMIFNGSTTRKSSSVAQVDLFFGNEDRTLPLDEDEVVVTRKLYRSGESEYLVNNHTSRLKDVRELFMDTGVGVDAYSVIEQGRVDGLLQSSPVERRLIFEEAAGISKYKARRKEAQRKLERTEQNLLRVEDIVEELEKRLRSVKLQAGKARNYQQYAERLSGLRASYSFAEYHRFTEESGRLTGDVQRYCDAVTERRAEISRHEARGAQTQSRLDEVNEQISHVDNELVRARSEQTAQQERIDGATQRVEEQRHIRVRSEERWASITTQVDESQADLTRRASVIAELDEAYEAQHRRLVELRDEDGALAQRLADLHAQIEEEKARIIDLLRTSAQVHNEIVRLNGQRESLVDQKGRITARQQEIDSELGRFDTNRGELVQRSVYLERQIATQGAALEKKRLAASRIDAVRQEILDALSGLKEQRSALESRRELLQDLQEKRDGVGSGVRQILSHVEAESEPTSSEDRRLVLGLVGEFIETDAQYASLVEAALGECDQYLVAPDTSVFTHWLAQLGALDGRFTALFLDRLAPVVDERSFADREGFVACMTDWVRVPRELESLTRYLFAKTVVVERLEHALQLAREDIHGHRFVTLAGEVVEPDGRMILGPHTKGTGLISRRSELRDIQVRLQALSFEVSATEDRLQRSKAESSYLESAQQELRGVVYELNTRHVECKSSIQKIDESIERLHQERPLLSHELSLVERQIEELHAQVQQQSQQLESLEEENTRREANVAQREDSLQEVTRKRAAVHEHLTEAKVSAGQIAEKRTAATAQIETLKASIRGLETSAQEAKHDIEQCDARIRDAEQTIATGREQVAGLAGRVAELEGRSVTLRGDREQVRVESEECAQQLKSARNALEEADAAHHDAEMKLAQTNIRRDELCARVAEELGITLAEQYESYDHEDRDWAAVDAEINGLKEKMSRLGNVNMDAIDEMAELEERHAFLTTQLEDLSSSRRQLERLIAQLDTESRERFQTAFVQVRDNFRALFRRLFGGGRADIVLEDPENIIECGIEIVAQPPGKELQIISLMSGGEKSLTAIALLMSIFQCRPAPFAILDEVDAALDEANNERFNRIIQNFMSESQFIVITHSRRTMDIADQLYGITMQEPGVSTRVSVQLADASAA